MRTAKTLRLTDYIKKIDKIEVMLTEIKKGLYRYERDLEKSIERGERDIEEGKVTVCKTREDLDRFFESL